MSKWKYLTIKMCHILFLFLCNGIRDINTTTMLLDNDMQLHQLQHQVVTLIRHHRLCIASKQKAQT